MAKLKALTDLLDRLDNAGIHYDLSSVREGAVMIGVTVPEERWEIEFMHDGDVEVEIFRANGEIHDLSAVETLFRKAAEDDQ